jgi:NAD(P)-dependent dehydrogenase (short-subunit alcohol dehydrogenase family)
MVHGHGSSWSIPQVTSAIVPSTALKESRQATMGSFTGQTVLITGSSRGIGAACARAAVAEGATVVVHGRTASPALAAIASELDCRAIAVDGIEPEKVKEALHELMTDGVRIDVLINSLGATGPRTGLETTDEEWIHSLKVNLLAPLHFIQHVGPRMSAAGYGRIVNITSMRGLPYLASEHLLAYSAAKAALSQVTAALAKTFAPHVTVNAVAPGFTATDMAATWTEQVRQQAAGSLVGRPATPQEIAEIVINLARPGASFLTGQTVLVDGGYGLAGR